MWKIQIPTKTQSLSSLGKKELVCMVFQGQWLLLVIDNVNNCYFILQ